MNAKRTETQSIEPETLPKDAETPASCEDTNQWPELPSAADVIAVLTGNSRKRSADQVDFDFLAGVERRPRTKRPALRLAPPNVA